MEIKTVGKTIIEWIRHPMGFIVFIWLGFKLMKEVDREYRKETALERMIYKK